MAKTTKKAGSKTPVKPNNKHVPVEPQAPRAATRKLHVKQGRLSKFLNGDNTKPDKMPTAVVVFKQAIALPWRHWEIFGGLLLVYAIINLILVGGVGASAGDLQSTKNGLSDVFTGHFSQLSTGFTLFAFLVTASGGTAGGVASAYQTMLLIITSLAIIWALRQVYSKQHIRVRDAYYNGLAPLVQFMLVFMVIGLEIIPAVAGGFAFSALVGGGVLTSWYEQVPVGLVSFSLVAWSFYMINSTIFALYIITLPGMEPLEAIRSSKRIVRGRQLQVLRKLLFLPAALAVLATVVMVPLTLYATLVAPYVFLILSIVCIVLIHSYMYGLYRALIAERSS